MALLCGRVTSNQILSALKGIPSVLSIANRGQGNYTINRKGQFVPPTSEEHDYKNMRLQRPLSPHLSIYNTQITMVLSISHRITGMMLSGYVMVLGCGALVLPGDINHYVTMIESLQLSSATIFAAKFALAAPFGYHMANGIRHLNWDLGRSLTNKGVISTGYIMLAGASLITAVLACL